MRCTGKRTAGGCGGGGKGGGAGGAGAGSGGGRDSTAAACGDGGCGRGDAIGRGGGGGETRCAGESRGGSGGGGGGGRRERASEPGNIREVASGNISAHARAAISRHISRSCNSRREGRLSGCRPALFLVGVFDFFWDAFAGVSFVGVFDFLLGFEPLDTFTFTCLLLTRPTSSSGLGAHRRVTSSSNESVSLEQDSEAESSVPSM